MSILIKEDSKFWAKREAVEGVLIEPTSGSDGFLQLKRDGVELEDVRDVKERNVFTGTLTDANPRLGMRQGKGTFPTEARAAGFEGNEPDFAIMLESILPSVNFLADRVVTGTGHTASRLYLNTDDSDLGRFLKGDCSVALIPGAYWPFAVTNVDNTAGANFIDITPPLPAGVFPDLVEIAKFHAYRGADAGHPTFTAGAYWGSGADDGGIRQAILGARTGAFSLEKFNTGELPEFKFGFEGLSFNEAAATDAPYEPVFDDALPGVVLNSIIYKDGVAIDVDGVQWAIEQPITFLKSTASANGRFTGRASGTRKITGTVAPYADGESIDVFTKWEAGDTFGLFGYLAKPDPTNGLELGSIVMFNLPNCFIKKPAHKDVDGVMTDSLEFQATGGDTGQDLDFSIGFC